MRILRAFLPGYDLHECGMHFGNNIYMGIPMCFPPPGLRPRIPPPLIPPNKHPMDFTKRHYRIENENAPLGSSLPQIPACAIPMLAFFLKTLIISSSAIIRISSEPVEISSELVEISSELVSTILELLIISVFRKTFQSVSHPLIPLCHEAKGESVHFHLYSPVC